MSPHDRQAQLADGAHKAVLRNVLGGVKPIITPIGLSELDFHFIIYPSLSHLSFTSISCSADGVGTGTGVVTMMMRMMMTVVMCKLVEMGGCSVAGGIREADFTA